ASLDLISVQTAFYPRSRRVPPPRRRASRLKDDGPAAEVAKVAGTPATARRLRVMISSRNLDLIPDSTGSTKLSDARLELKRMIEGATLFGQQIFAVWINEEAGADAGDRDSWDTCLKQATEADIILAIENGHAGWALDRGAIGICHAEIEAALHRAPEKVRL